MSSKMKFDRVILITGGSRGIGKAIAEQFKENGWGVATCARSLDAQAETPADFKFQCNVADPEQVKNGISEVLNHLGRIDVLVNNAGLAGTNSLNTSESDEFWHQIIDVNLHGTYYMCKYTAPHLPDSTGRIINISSILGLKGVPDQTAYCAAKHGVIGFTRAFAHYLAPRKITVNSICPGWTRTDMAKGRMDEIGISIDSLKTSVPLGRIIEPSEVADYVYFVATSKASAMMTGQSLSIDGGVYP